MTWRDPAPSVPPCPICGRNDSVERDRMKGGAWMYLCGREWTVFDGTTEEWARRQVDRDRLVSWKNNGVYTAEGPQ